MPHLGDQLSAYVDRRLTAPVLYAWDRHVVVCPTCRHRVDEEQRMLASLRNAPEPGISPALHRLLLGVATDGGATADDRAAGGAAGMPWAQTPARDTWTPAVAAFTPGLPALHRSLRRSVTVAALAAVVAAATAATLAPGDGAASIPTTEVAPATHADSPGELSSVVWVFGGQAPVDPTPWSTTTAVFDRHDVP
ncbi:MAG: hypothetical protein CSA84_03425 [Actinomycetales bacterium]|nr:MAG: hypothetical protein CSA84_03425 [Actinomycetales bacterium]